MPYFFRPNYMGCNHRGHTYVSHNYIAHNCTCHDLFRPSLYRPLPSDILILLDAQIANARGCSTASAELVVIDRSYIGHNHIGHNHIGHNCMGHNYIRHNHIGRNLIGHNSISHNYTGHKYIGHNYIDHDYIAGCSTAIAELVVIDQLEWQLVDMDYRSTVSCCCAGPRVGAMPIVSTMSSAPSPSVRHFCQPRTFLLAARGASTR